MWLLQLHLFMSILCFLTLCGFLIVFKERVKDNGWIDTGEEKTGNKINIKRKSKLPGFFACFVPIMNILIIVASFVPIFVKKKDFDNMCEETKKSSEN